MSSSVKDVNVLLANVIRYYDVGSMERIREGQYKVAPLREKPLTDVEFKATLLEWQGIGKLVARKLTEGKLNDSDATKMLALNCGLLPRYLDAPEAGVFRSYNGAFVRSCFMEDFPKFAREHYPEAVKASKRLKEAGSPEPKPRGQWIELADAERIVRDGFKTPSPNYGATMLALRDVAKGKKGRE